MYGKIVEHIRDKILGLGYDEKLVFIGEQNWENIMKLGKPIVEILPGIGVREAYGLGSACKQNWGISIIIATKDLEMKSEEMEIKNLTNLATLMETFSKGTVSVDNRNVTYNIKSFDTSRTRLAAEEGKGFYAVGCAVDLEVDFIK